MVEVVIRLRLAVDEHLVRNGYAVLPAYICQLPGRSSAANERWVEGCQELAEMLLIVSFGVDGDVDDLEFLCSCAQLLSNPCQKGECGGADARAMGVTECQRNDLPAIVAQLQFGAVRSTKREVRRHAGRIEDAGPQGGAFRGTDGERQTQEGKQGPPFTIHHLSLSQSVI